jgi:hypothetical protein
MPLNCHQIISALKICEPFQLWDGGQRDIYDIQEEPESERAIEFDYEE